MTNDSTYNLFTIILVVDRTLLHVVELTTTYLSRWNWTQVATSLSLLKQAKIWPDPQPSATINRYSAYRPWEKPWSKSIMVSEHKISDLCCQGNRPNLMGRDWLSSLKVSIGNIHKLENAKSVFRCKAIADSLVSQVLARPLFFKVKRISIVQKASDK